MSDDVDERGSAIAQSLSAQINTYLRVAVDNSDNARSKQLDVLGSLIGELEITMNSLREEG